MLEWGTVMELKKLEYLESLYRHRNFTKAAEEQFISQPSLSNAIQKLEAELGVTLINRNVKPLSFTAEGERFMWHVYKILESVQASIEDMKLMAESRDGNIRMIWPRCTVQDKLLHKIYTEYYKMYPNHQIILMEETLSDTIGKLLSGDVDLAYVNMSDNFRMDELEFIPILCCELSVIVSKNHPLSERKRVSFRELGDNLIYTYATGSLIRKKIEEGFGVYNLHPEMITVNQMDVVRNLIKEENGISFVTMDYTENDTGDPDLVMIPLEEQISFMKGFLVKRGSRNHLLQKSMISFVQGAVQDIRLQSDVQ